MPWILAGVALAAIAIVAAGVVLLGGDETSTPEEFAASVCEGWLDEATRLNEVIDETEDFGGDEPTEEQFAVLAEALRAAATGLDALAGEFEAAGRPEVAGGEQLVGDVTSAARETAERVRDLADQVDDTDPDDEDALDELGEAFEILEDAETDIIDGALGEGNADFGDFGNDELADAFADNGTCQEINDLLE
ncbi:MAG: hypothetical protein ACRD0A_07300 [Acidimicrobiales bacterium]